MTVTDPSLSAVVKALYGDGVDPAELAKALDASDVHIDGVVTSSKKKVRPVRRFVDEVKKDDPDKKDNKKGLAAGLLTGSAIEAAAAKDTIDPVKTAWQGDKTASRATSAGRAARRGVSGDLAAAKGVGQKVKALKPLAVGAGGKHLPISRGPGTSAALQVGNFAVGLAAAKTLVGPKKPKQDPVTKALRLSLRPVNPQAAKVPSLKARRGAGSPRVSKSVDADVEIAKLDSEKMQVFGWANVSKMNGQTVRDRQGDEIDISDLEESAYDFMLDSRVGGDQHRRLAKSLEGAPDQRSTVIESMVFTPEKIEKMGLPEDFPQGWWIGMQVQDPDTWELIKNGERTGFSVHGTGRREPIGKSLPDKNDVRTQAAVAGVQQAEKAPSRIKERLAQAKNPPPVRRKNVESAAVKSIGYQKQTRRLAVEMTTRPGEPYEYKAGKKVARRVLAADSKGRAYNEQVRNKLPRKEKFTAGDRVRLALQPVREEQSKAFGRGPLPSKAVRQAAFGTKVAKPTGVTMSETKMLGQDLKAAGRRVLRQGGSMPAYAARTAR